MAIKSGNIESGVVRLEMEKAASQMSALASQAARGERNMAGSKRLTVSAQAEIETDAIGIMDLFDNNDPSSTGRLAEIQQQNKVVEELFKTSTPLVIPAPQFINDPPELNPDFGKFLKVSDGTIAFDPATL